MKQKKPYPFKPKYPVLTKKQSYKYYVRNWKKQYRTKRLTKTYREYDKYIIKKQSYFDRNKTILYGLGAYIDHWLDKIGPRNKVKALLRAKKYTRFSVQLGLIHSKGLQGYEGYQEIKNESSIIGAWTKKELDKFFGRSKDFMQRLLGNALSKIPRVSGWTTKLDYINIYTWHRKSEITQAIYDDFSREISTEPKISRKRRKLIRVKGRTVKGYTYRRNRKLIRVKGYRVKGYTYYR